MNIVKKYLGCELLSFLFTTLPEREQVENPLEIPPTRIKENIVPTVIPRNTQLMIESDGVYTLAQFFIPTNTGRSYRIYSGISKRNPNCDTFSFERGAQIAVVRAFRKVKDAPKSMKRNIRVCD